MWYLCTLATGRYAWLRQGLTLWRDLASMCCGNCGLYFRESLCVFFPPHFLNLYFVLAYLRPPLHSHAISVLPLFYCWSNFVLLCVSNGIKYVYGFYCVCAFAQSIQKKVLTPQFVSLSALIVQGHTAPVGRRPFLHTHFFTKLSSHSSMHLCPNNDRSAFNWHSQLLLHNAVHFLPIMQSLPLLPLEREAFRSFEGKVKLSDISLLQF